MIRDLDCYAATTNISCLFLFSQIAENASPFSSSAEDDKSQLRRKKNSIKFLYKICIILLNSLNKTYLDENKKKTWQAIHSRGDSKADRQYCNLAKHKKERKNLNNQMA